MKLKIHQHALQLRLLCFCFKLCPYTSNFENDSNYTTLLLISVWCHFIYNSTNEGVILSHFTVYFCNFYITSFVMV